jgi:apolipoprotein N-acyltransferase
VTRFLSVVLFALIGAGAALGQAPFGLWPLTVLALAVAIVRLQLLKSWNAAVWHGWALGTGYFALSLVWIVQPFMVDPVRHGWMAPFALFFMAGGLALFWGAAAGLSYRLGSGGLTFAGALTLAELGRSYLFTGFPWALIGHGLIDTPLAQSAIWGGAHGLGLLVLLGAIGLAALWQRRWGVVLLAAAALLGSWVWGGVRLELAPVVTEGSVMRLIQPNAPQHQKWDPAFTPVFFRRQIEFTAAPMALETGARPDVIVWPETAVPVALEDADLVLERIAQAAQGAPVVVGIQRFDGPKMMNSAVLVDANGAAQQIYDKHHLVPFGEYIPMGDWLSDAGLRGFAARDGNGFAAGPGPKLMTLGTQVGAALPLICYEVVFPNDVNAAPKRPNLLLQITNDAWFGTFSGPYQHLAQARLRAIEQGLPLARAANTGVSAMIDPLGRVTAQIELGQAGYVDAVLPAPRQRTLYTKWGDWPLLTVALLLLLASSAGIGRARSGNLR